MPDRFACGWLFAIVACSLSGCSLYATNPVADQQDRGPSLSKDIPPPELMNVSNVMPVELEQVEPGQFCEFVTADPNNNSAANPSAGATRVAGKVISVDESTLVVTEAISIDSRPLTTQGTPVLQKVPYVSRLFKRTGVWVSPVPIPGEVRILKSSIRQVSRIEPEGWPEFRAEGFRRIGVDFDFTRRPCY